ncbi:MAG: glycosyltransferase family 4 protein [Bryobacteraceae bacterium]
MRVLHVIKTSDGALWAAEMASRLVALGVDVHVALPSGDGAAHPVWRRSGATIHIADLSLPVRSLWNFAKAKQTVQRLVDRVNPDLIHSHFVATTLMLRAALGRHHPIPRLFQVPGPLHLEHSTFRRLDLMTAGAADSWIASSDCIRQHYIRANVDPKRVFLSYYGTNIGRIETVRTNRLRSRLGVSDSQLLIGNICHMYAPKLYLGQFHGIKEHETLIDALALVVRKRSDVVGALVGGGWNRARRYEVRLRKRAARRAGTHIILPGPVDGQFAASAWADFDCVVHVPASENCGGVVEPLLAGVPTIASAVGGLPEVVVNGLSGYLVPPRDPEALADCILDVLDNFQAAKRTATFGQQRVRQLFDVQRTAGEVQRVYQTVVGARTPSMEHRNCGAFA